MKGESLRLGLDVGGTNIRSGVFSEHALLWEYRQEARLSDICHEYQPVEALKKVLSILCLSIEKALTQFPEVKTIGLAFPGFIHPVTHRLSLSPNLPGLTDVDLVSPLNAYFNRPVILENDALAAAYGEFMLSPSPSGSMVYVGLGTGVGGGLILSGKPHSGEHGVAMEIGHLIVEPGGRPCGCGNHGCLEQYVSATGIATSYGVSSAKVPEIAQRAISGASKAIKAFRLGASSLGIALAHVFKTLDVAHLRVGGGVSHAWPLMEPHFLFTLNSHLIPVLRGRIHVQVSTADDHAGMLGAAILSDPG